ncbi:MAG: hypothetical protein IJ153_04830 [Clostridia bacterium]|nr:hypothetical protein [Clostridia bacterium]
MAKAKVNSWRGWFRGPNEILEPRMEYSLALIFSAATLLGAFFDRGYSFAHMTGLQLLGWIAGSLALTELVRRLLRLLCRGLGKWTKMESNQREQIQEQGFLRGSFVRCFLFSLGVLLLCWLPVWLAYYPGFWNYDPWQADQVITGVYSKHHPMLHTLLLGNCYRFALEKGHPQWAPLLYSAIQGGICALIYACCCAFLRQRTRSNVFYWLTLLFFALFPVHPILAMSTTKDTLFSALILLSGLIFLRMMEVNPPRRKWLMLAEVAVIALVVMLRNNARYGLTLLILLCLFQIKKKTGRRMLAALLAGTLLGMGADWGLGKVLHASPALLAEMCSVPSQMAGRVQEEVSNLDAETVALLDDFYSMNEISYDPHLADPMKACLRLETREDLVRYLQGSFRLFTKYPAISIDSLLYTTEGLWNIRDISHTQIYGTGDRQGYMMTDIKSWYPMRLESKFPALEAFLEKILTENAFLKIPLLRSIFAPASYVYLLLLVIGILLQGMHRKWLLLPLFLLCLVGTIALGPGILPRYVYPLMVCAPLLIWMAMKSIRRPVPEK